MIRKGAVVRALVLAGLLAAPALAIPAQAEMTNPRGHVPSRVSLSSRGVTAAARWSIQPTPNPTAPTGQLMFGTCTSASSCTAVGTYVRRSKIPVTLAEWWNGRRWHTQRTPNPAGARVSVLNGVACSGPSACTAVGDSVNASGKEVTLAERWNGRNWRIQRTPNPTGSLQSVLNAIACASSTSCTAVGQSSQGTLAERWNGRNWRIQRAANPSQGGGGLLAVTCTVSASCSAAGFSNAGTLAERWNGRSWRIQPTPNPGGTQFSFLHGVSCTSSTACTAVGGSSSGTLAERWNGTRWRIQPTPNPSGSQFPVLVGVDCSSQSACTAVGGYGNASGGFFTLAERWNGHRWTIQRTLSPGGGQGDVLLGVACPRSSACTAFGYSHGSGTPLTMAQRWNGTGWRLQGTPNPAGAAETQLNSIACPSTSNCFAVGTAGPTLGITSAVAQYWNGTSWQNQPIATVPGVSLNAVSCASRLACFAVGGSNSGLLAERWNGTKWRIQHVPTPAGGHFSGLGGVSCTSPSFCMAAGAYNTTASQGGPVKPLTERWNGKVWSILPTPNPAGAVQTFLGGISCTSPSACTTTGERHFTDGIVHTVAERWNGNKWRVQPTPNPHKAPGASLGGVACTGPSACISVGLVFNSFGNPAGTLAERWNGTGWKIQPTPSPPGNQGLAAVACPGRTACTAVGLTSTNAGGMLLAERWNGTKWQVQPTPLIPALSVMTSSPPAVACPALSACTSVGGYEAPGPTSLTLAERWKAGGATTQPVARPSSGVSPNASCARPLPGTPLFRADLGRKPSSAPTGPTLGPRGPWSITRLNSCTTP